MVRSRKQLRLMKAYNIGDTVWFEIDGEFHYGTISRLGEEWPVRPPMTEEYEKRIVAEVLFPGGKEVVPVEELLEESPNCSQHGRKLYSTKREQYICPFCKS